MREKIREQVQNVLLAVILAVMIYSVFAGFYIQSYDWIFVIAGGVMLLLYCILIERVWKSMVFIAVFLAIFGMWQRMNLLNGFYTISNKIIDVLNQNTGLGFYYYVPVSFDQSRIDCILAGCFVLLCIGFLIALLRNHLMILFLLTGTFEITLVLTAPYSVASSFFLFLGMWFACYNMKKKRYYFGWAFCLVFGVISLALFFYDQSHIDHVTRFKKNVWISMRKLIQGKEENTSGIGGVGNGEIGKINVLSMTGKHLFSVSAESKKTLYLREYISDSYQDGRWKNTFRETNLSDGEVSAALPFIFAEQQFKRGLFSRQKELIIRYPEDTRFISYLPVPYFSDLNNIAGSVSGDGSVVREKGRREYRIPYYEVKKSKRLLKMKGKINRESLGYIEEGSSKDYYLRAAQAYGVYVKQHDLTVPKEIQKELKKEFGTKFKGESTRQKIQWIKKYLKKHYKYTYQPGGTPKGIDPVIYFYRYSKKGFCTQYASLTVMMLRSAGIPARYVEGYKISGNDFHGTKADVTDYNAHAWAEIYIDNVGWAPIDTTGSYTGKTFYEKVKQENKKKAEIQRKKWIVTNVKRFVTIIMIVIFIIFIWTLTKMLQRRSQWKGMSNREKVLWYAQEIEKRDHVVQKDENTVQTLVLKVIEKARYSQHDITKEEVLAVQRYLNILKKKV